MTTQQYKLAIQKGREMVAEEYQAGCNIIGFGEMGIGNTSSAALIMHKITGYDIESCTGRGTGHDDDGLQRKINILKQVARLYNTKTPQDILATYGGFEIVMICGAMLEAKAKNMLLLIDGFIVTSALLVAHAIDQTILDNAIFFHTSQEKGHQMMCKYLKVKGLLSLGMRLGEGSGVAVAYPVVKVAVAFLNEMSSFEQAGVSNKN